MKKTTPLLLFTHVEKTAGTTLIHILRHNYFPGYLDARPFRPSSKGVFREPDLKIAKAILPGLECIAGHSLLPVKASNKTASDRRYITLMRDPVRRYVSQYRYWTEKLGRNLSFERFLSTDEVRNVQTRKFAGCEELSKARDVLSRDYFLVGLVERFDEFLVLLKKQLEPFEFDIRYERRNSAEPSEKFDVLADKYIDRIRENNLLDIALYDYVASSVYPSFRNNYGGDLEKDVGDFVEENRSVKMPMKRRYMDYLLRKLYLEPVTGLVRISNGMQGKGSY